MRHHIDALGLLHSTWGAFAVLTGASLAVLAAGTWASLDEVPLPARAGDVAVWIFVLGAVVLVMAGVMSMLAGRSIGRRRRAGRTMAMALAVPNLVILPFGTALGIYTCWVLLNDDARQEFGRPPRRTPVQSA